MKACNIAALGQSDITFPREALKDIEVDGYTLKDIEEAIRQPLRDYRDQFDGAILKSDVLDISNLHVGDSLSGTVRNVVDFGAFVDIGLHEDGLVHITRMSRNRVGHPSDIVSVGDIVTVYVSGIDAERQRVQLSLLPLDQLVERDRNMKAARKKPGDRKPREKSEDEKLAEATRRLMDRFGKN